MMCRYLKVLQVLISCNVACIAFGQNDSTFLLDEVAITGLDLSKFSSGTVLKKVDLGMTGGLSAIGRETTIHFKNYGNQQLSTISFRGTSASHTNVVWNGIQVNSPTLGQTDFSVWPPFLTDQVIIQHGGASSLFGSGAIGGSIILDNSSYRKDSLISIYGAIGSFGQFDGGLKLHLDLNDRLSLESKGFSGKIENNFPLKRGGNQEHASVRRWGLSQKINYSHKKGKLFSEVAYTENDRDIQPTITSADRSTLLTKNFRSAINHELFIGESTHKTTLGLISDQTVFNDSSITKANRLSGTHAVEQNITNMLSIRYGGTVIHEWTQSDNYSGTRQENQYHLFASATYFPIDSWSLTANLREAFHQGCGNFIPSLGTEYVVLRDVKQEIVFRGQISKDYRIPTFNDLHWQPGGNSGLLPERSHNIEGGVDWNYKCLSLSLTGFYSDIKDWIQWRPIEGIWTPQNLRRVKTKGLEADLRSSWNISPVRINTSIAYTYVRSEDQSIEESNQLPYVPEHEVFGNLSTHFNRYILSITGNFTGVRYTTLTNSRPSEIDEFFLMDASISKSVIANGANLNLRLLAQNILNTDYQIVKNHTMPGRSFLIELTTKF